MLQHKKTPKVTCNVLKLATICASHFAFLLLPTGSPLMKISQFWPLLPPPGQTKCYLTAKSSLQHSIHIFRKSKKNQQLFLWAFFEEPHLYDRGGSASPPPHPIGLMVKLFEIHRVLSPNLTSHVHLTHSLAENLWKLRCFNAGNLSVKTDS